MTEVKKYNKNEFKELLALFQKGLDSGEYTERISYEVWRRINKAEIVRVRYDTLPEIGISYDYGLHIDNRYITSIYDNGFGSFFYNHEIKERKEVTNKEVLNAMSACAASASAASAAIDATKVSAFEAKANCMSAYDAAYNFDLTFTCDEYNNCHYSDLDTSKAVGNYGSTDLEIAGPNHTNTIELNIPSLDHLICHKIDGTWDSAASKNEVEYRFRKLELELQKKVDKAELEKGKEEETMKNFNFDFGSCAGNENIRMSMYGIAVKNNSGVWVSYNSQAQEIVDVDILNFEGSKYLYKMPMAIKDVAIGDVIIHNRVPMFVVGVSEDHKNLTVVDVRAGENKTIIPTTNMFGFNFCTKVVSLFNMGTPTADQPFGNMLPLLLMSDGKGTDIDPMMLMFMMNQGGFDMTSNPMMMYLMMKDGKDFDPMLMFMMMNQNQSQNHSCHCGKHHEEVKSV